LIRREKIVEPEAAGPGRQEFTWSSQQELPVEASHRYRDEERFTVAYVFTPHGTASNAAAPIKTVLCFIAHSPVHCREVEPWKTI